MNSKTLRELGFQGFVPLLELPTPSVDLPRVSGAYAVIRSSAADPGFLAASVGGRHKGRDPSVDSARLATEWVSSTDVLYIGRAKNLRRRITDLARFGRGKPVSHWGGRLVWQLSDSEDLLVAWILSADPNALEADLVGDFVAHHGALPFANLNQPRKELA